MGKNNKDLFKNLPFIEPPQKLSAIIFTRIKRHEKRMIRTHLALFGTLAIASVMAFIPALQYALQELSESGLTNYLSLLFSDGGTVLASWKELVLSLAESFPIFGITTLLSVLFILLGSLRAMAKYLGRPFVPA